MLTTIYRSAVLTVILAVLLCGVYPLVVTVIARVCFPATRSGGIIHDGNGDAIGARLIGQNFSRPGYFHGRPSAAGDKGYDAANSSGSNSGPTSQKLAKAVEENVARVLQENPGLKHGEVPVDLVTASASGLDPHISPRGAEVQVARVARSRGISEETVRELVRGATDGPQLRILGDAGVNVLLLNLSLDALAAQAPSEPR